MAILLKRQLSEDEKNKVLKTHGRVCFATGHPIPDSDTVHFDHIRAFSLGGETELNNIAPLCQKHNLEKGQFSLEDFRTKIRIGKFFETGQKLTLKHLLAYFKKEKEIGTFGQPVSLKVDDGVITLQNSDLKYSAKLYECPTTGWKYFYVTLDVDVINSDDDEEGTEGLQPRYLIEDKVFSLYRHFQRHPVLQPSIGRVVDERIRLFDGQHKIAALLWNDRRKFECKIYLEADARLLNQTNIDAHEAFSQTRFYTSVMVVKLGRMFGQDFELYKAEDTANRKTEAGFIEYLKRLDADIATRGDISKRFRSYLYNSVLEHDENKLKPLISASNRSTSKHPITMDMLQKSLFYLLYRVPTDDDMTTSAYNRDHEQKNMIAILNMLWDAGLSGWDPNLGRKNDRQRSLERLLRSKSMMAWSELFRDALNGKLDIYDADERERPLYRELDEEKLKKVRSVIDRLITWQGWYASEESEIDRILSDNKSAVKEWFKARNLTTGYLMGASS